MIMKRLLLICLVLCFWGEYGYAVEKQKDIEIVYNRLLEEYLSDSVDVSQAEKDLAAAVSTEEETGAGFPVIPVLAAAAILAAVVMGILLIRRKKNRTMDEEEALLDELERSSEDES